MKKFIAVLLAVLTMLSLCSVLGFAGTKTVPAPQNLTFNENGIATWDKVPDATGYQVTLYLWTYDSKEGRVLWQEKGTWDVKDANGVNFNDKMGTGKYTFAVRAYMDYPLYEGGKMVTSYSPWTQLEDEKAITHKFVFEGTEVELTLDSGEEVDFSSMSFVEVIQYILKLLFNFFKFAGDKSGLTQEIYD